MSLVLIVLVSQLRPDSLAHLEQSDLGFRLPFLVSVDRLHDVLGGTEFTFLDERNGKVKSTACHQRGIAQSKG
uniref:Putative secreted protein n=1 Tax=Anopheles darlingi TaxID=43151 RepID=A0A2M4D0I4_ANODA